jgi:hypothetical protein
VLPPIAERGVVERLLEPVELDRAVREDLALAGLGQVGHVVEGDLERCGEDARRMREVRLPQDAILSDRVHQVTQMLALEPGGGVHLALEVLAAP